MPTGHTFLWSLAPGGLAAAWRVDVAGLLLLALVGMLAAAALRARRSEQQLLQTVAVIELEPLISRHLNGARPALIFLPPGYDGAAERGYPALVMNDGQDAQALGLRETLAHLYAKGSLRPVIVIAVPASNERLREYGTAAQPNAQGLGDLAAPYADFLVEELMPAVRERFSVSDIPENVGVMGMSLGGLSAFDVAWSHPEQFGLAGVFSGSFWWRAGSDAGGISDGQLIAPALIKARGYRPGFRAWLQAGTRDETADRDGDGIIDSIADTLAVLEAFAASGYQVGREIRYLEVEDGRHRPDTWREALPDFLMWAFGPGKLNRSS